MSLRQRWLDVWGAVADDLDGVAESVERQIAGHYDTLNWCTDLADKLYAALQAIYKANQDAISQGDFSGASLTREAYNLVNAAYQEVNIEDQGEGGIAVSAHDLEATQRELAEIIEAAREFAAGRTHWG
jgi:hypothetical protein